MEIRNPRTGEFDYKLKVDSPEHIQEYAEVLRKAQRAWFERGLDFRIKILQRWKEKLIEHKTEIAQELSIDTGRNAIALLEVNIIISMIDGWTYKAPLLIQEVDRNSAVNAEIQIREKQIPFSLVGVISPWNFPITLSMIDAIPALFAGSAVLLKPSEVTPRHLDPLEQSIHEVEELAAVFQIVRGSAEAGKATIDASDAICFTGSIKTGKIIAEHCARNFIPAFLELGGKDPAIVLADANIDLATDGILKSGAGATGQACQSLERIYVHDSIYEEFLESLIQKASKITLNAAKKSEGQIGPIIFAQQAEVLKRHIQDAKEKGATIHTGGEIENHHGGLYCRPTVLSNVNHDMLIMQEESFGPLLPVMSFQTEQEAIDLANDSIYGLSASVFSTDLNKAAEIGYQIEAGAISINDGGLTNLIHDVEKSAFKQSGLNGSRMGDAGLLRFFRKRALLVQTGKPISLDSYNETEL